MTDFWDAQAEHFDELPDHGLQDPMVRAAWASLLLSQLPRAPARIADVGCGTGTLGVLLGQLGYQVSGIDLSPRMVGIARDKAAAAGIVVDFEIGDAMAPPWPRATFDAVLCRHVLWDLPDPGSGLDRWLQLLNPDGVLLLVEGRWGTGRGLSAQEALMLLRARDRDASATVLSDPMYWGGPISDERFLLVSPPVEW